MDSNYFPLGNVEDNKMVKILRIGFGVACLGMAIWWINFNLRSSKTDWTLWVTIVFLTGFGLYQIWAGLGKATRFIIVEQHKITIRKNSLLAAVNIKAGDTAKIDIYPLSIVFLDKTDGKYLLRLGTVNYETNEKIIDEIIRFAEENNINYEVIDEEI